MKQASHVGRHNQAIWDAMFERLASFHSQHGHGRVPVRYAKDRKLGNWISNQRQLAVRAALRPERRRRLLALGVIFDIPTAHWEEMYEGLVEFKRQHGHTLVPREWKAPRGLGGWVTRQRSEYQRGLLAAERIRRLNKIRFNWNPGDPRWPQIYARLEAFRKTHGHCNVPSGTALGQWVYKQRKFRRLRKLDGEQIQRLDAIGFDWVKPFVIGDELEARWRQKVRELAAFKKKHGHCQVPQSGRARYGLGVWVANLRAEYPRGNLRPDRVRELERLGFAWTYKDPCWDNHFAELVAFKRKHGHCNVAQKDATNPALGAFVATARGCRREGTLTPERIRRLESIGFVWEPMELKWERRYSELTAFRRQRGHCRVPQHGPHGALAEFITRLRRQKRQGRLSAERIVRLETLGLDWHPRPAGASRSRRRLRLPRARTVRRKTMSVKKGDYGRRSEIR
jgi:hypothetical protein